MTSLWVAFGVMLCAGVLFVCWPLYRNEKRLGLRSVSAVLVIIAISGSLYAVIGSPGAPSGAAATPSVDDMVATLAARLQQNPDDVTGWKMLGRSYVQLQRFDEAVEAYEQALEREGGNDAQTYADLGEAVFLAQDQRMAGRASQMFEAALTAAPENPKALFYGGLAAIERNDRKLAAERWESLLAQAPPENVQAILRARISEWRGESTVAAAGSVAAAPAAASVSISIGVSKEAGAALPANATVFVIARDPAQPSPPIAVARRTLAELPTTVVLTDAEAMIPGRTLGQFRSVEILVRASASGNPMSAPGDWFGRAEISVPQQDDLAIEIAQSVQ